MLILHTADTHLGFRQYGIPEREDDIYDVLDEIAEIAVRERVDAVVHSGDFFDSSRPPPQALLRGISFARRLSDAGIPLILVAGDHDLPKRRAMPPVKLIDELVESARLIGLRGAEEAEVRCRSGVLLRVAGVRAYPQVQVERLRAELSKLRGGDVLLLHQGIKQLAYPFELELAELPRGFKYYALGHVHSTKIVPVPWGGVAAYPGSPEFMRVDEVRAQSEKHVLLVDLSSGEPRVEKVRLSRVRPQIYEEVEFSRAEDAIRRLAVRLSSARTKKPLLHLMVVKAPPLVRERERVVRLAERLLEGKVLRYRIVFETAEQPLAQPASTTQRVDVHSLLEKLLGSKELAELAEQLIEVLGVKGVRKPAVEEAVRLVMERYGLR